MKILSGSEAQATEQFFLAAAQIARRATCLRAKCGSVIVKEGEIIGQGYNSPPLDDESARACVNVYTGTLKPHYDKTCCIHAEWRAVLDATKHHPAKLPGSRLYFMRIDEQDNLTKSGDPFCTVCSRLTMEAGVSEFALWQEQGMAVWSLADYNRDSYAFYKPIAQNPS